MPNDRFAARAGFSVLELLIVLGVIGIIAAIAIPNFLTAMARSRQKQTMEDIRSVAIAWEARASDLGRYNAAGGSFSFPAAQISGSELQSLVSPTYIRSVPTRDGWNQPFQFGLDADPASATKAVHYGIRSAGADATFAGTYVSGVTTAFDCDIVYSDGAFIVYPDGVQLK